MNAGSNSQRIGKMLLSVRTKALAIDELRRRVTEIERRSYKEFHREHYSRQFSSAWKAIGQRQPHLVTATGLAAFLGIHKSSIVRIARGENVPGPVSRVLYLLRMGVVYSEDVETALTSVIKALLVEMRKCGTDVDDYEAELEQLNQYQARVI